MKTQERKVTSIEEIKARTAEAVVELPGFGDGEPFVARLRRIGLLEMAQAGSIPNELLGAVSELYTKGTGGITGIKDNARVLDYYASRALVEPSYQELAEAGVALTDRQLLAIYYYGIGGVEGLKPFR